MNISQLVPNCNTINVIRFSLKKTSQPSTWLHEGCCHGPLWLQTPHPADGAPWWSLVRLQKKHPLPAHADEGGHWKGGDDPLDRCASSAADLCLQAGAVGDVGCG